MQIERDQFKAKISQIPHTEKEEKVIYYRFGLDDGITHTLEETGKLFGVTRERIRQIEAKILERIEQLKVGLLHQTENLKD